MGHMGQEVRLCLCRLIMTVSVDTVLDDNAFVYCSFLKMSQISRANVTGYMAHACDYYQVTADLDIN